MPTGIPEDTFVQESEGWIARVRPPSVSYNGRLILLLHGWTGDENSMWFFSRRLPAESWIVSPRAPLVCPAGGYAWGIATIGQRPDIAKFRIQADKLMHRLAGWVPEFSPADRLDIIGFSQGAAMAYTLCLASTPMKVAPLAGYIPSGFSEPGSKADFSKLQLFISHNSDDSMLPVEESRNARDYFAARGAVVNYCENTGGHKMSSACVKELDVFFRD